jgi:hypothetical protein
MRQVPEEIPGGADPQSAELLRPSLSDPLQELDRGIEADAGRNAWS